MADLEAIATDRGLPYWWVESVAVEYLPCRRFAQREIWDFDFSPLTDAQVLDALDTCSVVARGTVFHNLRPEVMSVRMVSRLFSSTTVPPAADVRDVCPEGEIGPHHQMFSGNPIVVWDPKLNFSRHVQVLDDGQLYQWEVARFEAVEGRSYGKWVSDVLDLDALDAVDPRLALLRNPPQLRRPGESGWQTFHDEVARFYEWIEQLREPIRQQLRELHRVRRLDAPRSTAVVGEPPYLSLFEDFRVAEGEVATRLHAEPLFYRAVHQHVQASLEWRGRVDEHGLGISRRTEAIVNAAAFLEAYVNSVGSEVVPRWDLYEKLTIEGKWQLCLATLGFPDRYQPGAEPYQTLGQVVVLRNRWLHYGRPFEKVRRTAHGVQTWIDARMSFDFIERLPARLRHLVADMSAARGQEPPGWLESGPDWDLTPDTPPPAPPDVETSP